MTERGRSTVGGHPVGTGARVDPSLPDGQQVDGQQVGSQPDGDLGWPGEPGEGTGLGWPAA